jgi:hypothetical protein
VPYLPDVTSKANPRPTCADVGRARRCRTHSARSVAGRLSLSAIAQLTAGVFGARANRHDF